MTEQDKDSPVTGGELVEPFDPAEASEETGVEEVVSDAAIQEELANLQQEVGRLKELYLRKLAEFDNYRKRQEREMAEFRRFANSDLLRECLPVVDNLERALAVPVSGDAGIRQGVELVLRQLKDALGKFGLVELDPSGLPFDPAEHEAIQRREVAGLESPTVVHVLQKGFRLSDRLLRPALVIVAVPVAAAPQTTVNPTEENHDEDRWD
jgi:molecular chaperone GrpE